jgi:membrane-bound serine protease (ClpP class)
MVWLGIVLLVVAVGLIVAEFFTGSGLMAAVGIVALIAGLVVLFTGGTIVSQADLWVIVLILVLVLALVVFIVWRVVKTHQTKVQTGREDMVGNIAVVRTALDPEGTVFYQGELWSARSDAGTIESGEEVIITKVDRLNLLVTRKETQ